MRTLLPLMALALTLSACKKEDTDSDIVVDCSDRALEVPAPRGEAAGVWDPVGERLVFFGGDVGRPENCRAQTSFSDETWAFQADCDTFAFIDTAGPTPRGRHAVTRMGRKMILHGGRFREGTSGNYTQLDDTWSFDLDTSRWSRVAFTGPGVRSNHGIAAIGEDKVLLFGGNSNPNGLNYTPLGDLWQLQGETWTELSPANEGPVNRLFHAVAASPDGSKFYVYGGGDENAFIGPFFGDLWELDVATLTWTELHSGSTGAPDGRIWPNLLHDGEKLILWGGHDDGALGNTNQLWTFDLGSRTWTELEVGDVFNQPANGFCDFPADFVVADLDAPERRNAGVAALGVDGDLFVFGGKTDCGISNDLWSYDFDTNTWTNRSTATEGEICLRAARECSTMCF